MFSLLEATGAQNRTPVGHSRPKGEPERMAQWQVTRCSRRTRVVDFLIFPPSHRGSLPPLARHWQPTTDAGLLGQPLGQACWPLAPRVHDASYEWPSKLLDSRVQFVNFEDTFSSPVKKQ